MSRQLYKKLTLIWALINLIGNAGFIYLFNELKHDPLTAKFHVYMLFFVLFNTVVNSFVLDYMTYRLIERWGIKKKILVWQFLFLSPFIGLYFYFLFLADKKISSWSFKKHLWSGIILSFFISFLIGAINPYSYQTNAKYFSSNFMISFQYISKVFDDTYPLEPKRSSKCEELSSAIIQYDCFLSETRSSIERPQTWTGQFLDMVKEVVFATKRKKTLIGYNQLLAVIRIMSEPQIKNHQNSLALSPPIGSYLIAGSVEMPLLLWVDTLIHGEARVKLQSKIPRVLAFLEKQFQEKWKKNLSAEEVKRYSSELEIVRSNTSTNKDSKLI